MKKRTKWLLWVMAVIALSAVYVYNAARPLQAELLDIQPRDIEKKFVETGTLSAVWERDLFSAAAGRVTLLTVKEGDTVAAGEVLVRLDTREIEYQIAQLKGQLKSIRGQEKQAFSGPREAQVAQQQLAVKQAEQQLNTAREEYRRAETLFAAGAVSKSVLEEAGRAVTQLELIHAQQVQALKLMQEESGPPEGTAEHFAGLAASLQAQIDLLANQKRKAVLTAPADGAVAAVHVSEGAVVAPGTPLLSLFRPGKYELELFILPEDIRKVKTGLPVQVSFRDEQNGESFSGKMTAIAPTAVEKLSALGVLEQRVKVTVSVSGEVAGLRPGFAMEVTFVTEREAGKLAVPKTALFRLDGESAVWVVRNGRAGIQPVQKGLETDDDVVIISGLAEGERVILNPRLEGLKEGVRIVEP
jgi:HlyD family secretion protein